MTDIIGNTHQSTSMNTISDEKTFNIVQIGGMILIKTFLIIKYICTGNVSPNEYVIELYW